MRLKISSRKSDLARLQAHLVGDALKKQYPDIEIQFHFRESLGDKNLNDPLWKMPEKGVFTEDFYQDLLTGETDMVVHSWKDLPTELKPDTLIAATLPRADQRDLLLFKKTSIQKKPEAVKIFSSSPRRAYNLGSFFKTALPFSVQSCEFLPVRGNVQTRVRKLMEDPQVDGLIVAKAAMDRLLSATAPEFQETRQFLRQCLQNLNWMVLPLTENPNAAAQGALAIEIASHRKDLLKVLEPINCRKTFDSVRREREILSSYGGGCHQKIGCSVLPRSFGTIELVRGETLEGKVLLNLSLKTEREIPWDKLKPVFSKESNSTQREKVDFEIPASFNAVYVSRVGADLSQSLRYGPIVWTAGLSTWKALAAQGVWVHGSSEGWGEEEISDLTALHPEQLKWLRLTHDKAPSDSRMPSLATYRIQSESPGPDVSEGNFFYWRSGTQFQEALARNPQLKDQYHACGPGRTHQALSRLLGNSEKLFIFLSEENWKNACKK